VVDKAALQKSPSRSAVRRTKEGLMPATSAEPSTLLQRVVQNLKGGPRTATYTLATTMALVGFSWTHRPTQTNATLDVPLNDLTCGVLTLYWQQLIPFDGFELRQSAETRSPILESIDALRAAAGDPSRELRLDVAARLAPAVFLRAVNSVSVYLAQQPLPRLQRSPGAARSVPFLYDDSFLHDDVTPSELQRHNNAIRLHPGVAEGLAALQEPFFRTLQTMWTYDVLRMNRISPDNGQRLEEHLFGRALSNWGPKLSTASSSNVPSAKPSQPNPKREPKATITASSNSPSSEPSQPDPEGGMATSSFAARLNRLFEIQRGQSRQPLSSGEVAAKIRQAGFPMTVSTLSRLRSGVGPVPLDRTTKALASFFGVEPSYFFAEGDESAANAALDDELRPPAGGPADKLPVAEAPAVGDPNAASVNQAIDTGPRATPVIGDDSWGAVVRADINDVAAVCDIRIDGCWLAPTSKSVRCRPSNDARAVFDLPKIALHRWAWMVDNGLTEKPIPSYLIQIRRHCRGATCCNPAHLYAASPGGQALARSEVVSLLRTVDTPLTGSATDGGDDSTDQADPIVLVDDLGSISDLCPVDGDGCWIAPTASPVPCRAEGDERADRDLPQLAFHRWIWMVVHDRSSNPLPGNMFYVRRHCRKGRCCNPDHLYLTRADGKISSLREAELWLQWQLAPQQDDARADLVEDHHTDAPHDGWRTVDTLNRPAADVGRHQASTSDGDNDYRRVGYGADRTALSINVFADRLNELFENHSQSNGVPYTSAEVAAALREDGLTVSESLIARLRAASGGPPNAQTTEALAYFFNVDADYFSAAVDPAPIGDHTAAKVGQHATIGCEPNPTVSPTLRVQVIPLSVADLGRIVAGLSGAASDCVSRSPAEVLRARSLLSLLADVGEILSTPRESFVISRPLLQRVVSEWTSAGNVANARQSFVARLSALVNEP
jgi:transcriptional regulator with XRE-family HTH domain